MSDFDPFVGRTEPGDGSVVETDRVALWHHDTGGDGEPLVLLGGFTAGHFGFDLVRPYLGAERRLITWEPRGLGLSATPDPASSEYSVPVWADDLDALLDALELDRVQIWAMGFGSYIAHRFAATHPERLGALATYTDVYARDPAKGYPLIWDVYGAIVRNFGTVDFGARVLANVFDVSDIPWFGPWEARNIEAVLHPETVEATVGHCLLEADVREDLAKIQAPTMVIQGSRTWDGHDLDPADHPSLSLMAERIPNFELASIPDTHPAYVFVQEPEAVAAAAKRFFAAHPLDRSGTRPSSPPPARSTSRPGPRARRPPHRRGQRNVQRGPEARLLDRHGDATVYTERFRELWPDAPHRVLRRSIVAAEAGEGSTVGTISAGAERIDVPRFAGFAPVADAEGEIEAMACFAGEGVGSITAIRPAGDIVTEFSTEAAALLRSAVPFGPQETKKNS